MNLKANMKNTKLILSTVAAAALLSACGGGGGGTTASVPSATPVTVSASSSAAFEAMYQPIQTTVPAAPYAAGSREAAEFKTLNEQRSACGFGLLSNNESLRLAAVDHSKYLDEYGQRITNDGLSIHEQFLKYPNGFTGATFFDRAKFRGYGGSKVSETLGGSLQNTSAARFLISAPYHAGAIFTGYMDVGISAGAVVVFDYGSQSKLQRKDASILTYPCSGVTGVAPKLPTETPSPYSPRNLGANPIGHPVYFFGDESVAVVAGRKSQIDVPDLVVTEDITGSVVAMLPVQNRDNDPNAAYVGPGFAYAAPDKPLKNLTKYRVRATVKANGVTTLVDYTFTTG